MVFSSIPFLFFFLPVFLVCYYAVPFRAKNYILLAFSLVFYAWGEPVYIILMIAASLVDYTNGRLMTRFGTAKRKRAVFLAVSICINLSMLLFFKYADFLIEIVNRIVGLSIRSLGLGLPIGISFFTFQTMSYSIDLYRGQVRVEKNYATYLTYVSMFPQLIAGPIVRFATVQEELHRREITLEGFRTGMIRFLMGLFKKVLIANQIGAMWELIKGSGGSELSVLTAWFGAASFTLQLYFDFSAYSDMAIGMGRMFGFHFLENFNYPLYADSITDFWRRWHISLSTWFRDYIYIPLGGNRCSVAKHLRNMAAVWFLTGLWHGASANYVLWGIYYGVLLALEKYVWGKWLKRLPKILRHIYAVLIVVFGFIIFVFEDFGQLKVYLSSMFHLAGNTFAGAELIPYLINYGVFLLAATVLAMPVFPWFKRKLNLLSEKSHAAEGAIQLIVLVVTVCLFLITTAYLVGDSFNPFLYFRF